MQLGLTRDGRYRGWSSLIVGSGVCWSLLLAACWTPSVSRAAGYIPHGLVSDQPGVADHTDPDLVNSWGVAFNPTGFVWVTDNHSGKSTLYDGLGNKQSLIVTIPDAAGTVGAGGRSGIVFSGGSDFVVTQGADSGPARFIFAAKMASSPRGRRTCRLRHRPQSLTKSLIAPTSTRFTRGSRSAPAVVTTSFTPRTFTTIASTSSIAASG